MIEADADGRIRRFAEKPQQPLPMAGPCRTMPWPRWATTCSRPRVLLQALEATHAAGGTDFGGHLLPALVASHRLMAYDFTTNRIEGLPAGCDAHYWRDVGTLDAYFAAHMDALAAAGAAPRFDVGGARAGRFAVPSRLRSGPARVVDLGATSAWRRFRASAQVERSILRPGASIGERAEVSRCILGENVEVGARLPACATSSSRRTTSCPPASWRLRPARDQERLPVSEGGIVVIPRGYFSTTVASQAVSPGVAAGRAVPAVGSLH